MKMDVIVNREEKLIRALMSETRLKIIGFLKEPKHISKLANEAGLDRSTVAYHLNLLKKVGIVHNEYRPITNPEPGWVGNYFIINETVLAEAIELATQVLENASG